MSIIGFLPEDAGNNISPNLETLPTPSGDTMYTWFYNAVQFSFGNNNKMTKNALGVINPVSPMYKTFNAKLIYLERA
jgi:hypothetical protein